MNCQIMFSFPFIQFLTTYSIKRHLSVEMQIAVAWWVFWMEARALLNVPVLKNLRKLCPYHTQDQFSLPSVTRLTISVLRIGA